MSAIRVVKGDNWTRGGEKKNIYFRCLCLITFICINAHSLVSVLTTLSSYLIIIYTDSAQKCCLEKICKPQTMTSLFFRLILVLDYIKKPPSFPEIDTRYSIENNCVPLNVQSFRLAINHNIIFYIKIL